MDSYGSDLYYFDNILLSSSFFLSASHNYLSPLSQWSPEEELILTKLTFIGSGASLCALVVTLMLFTVLE